MQTLFGGLVIENTLFDDVSFFSTDNVNNEFQFFCEKYGYFIRNNSRLPTVPQFIHLWPDEDYKECTFEIENNPLLSTIANCDYWTLEGCVFAKTTKNYESSSDGCRGDQITIENVKNYGTCVFVLDGLWLMDMPTFNASFLSVMMNIKGPISIQNTGLQNLSFFEYRVQIAIDNVGLAEYISINIRNNPQMTRFGTPELQFISFTWKDNRFANFENLHPDFCLSYDEMAFFVQLDILFINLDASFCKDESVSGTSTCKFKNLSKLKSDCTWLIGDVVVESGDEKYVNRLNTVEIILGTLTIRNTTLKNLNFLSGLKYIASLDKELPAITVASNKNLKNVDLEGIKHIISRNKKYLLLEDNHPSLPNSTNYLDAFSQELQDRLDFSPPPLNG